MKKIEFFSKGRIRSWIQILPYLLLTNPDPGGPKNTDPDPEHWVPVPLYRTSVQGDPKIAERTHIDTVPVTCVMC